jgi:hypothetical protein
VTEDPYDALERQLRDAVRARRRRRRAPRALLVTAAALAVGGGVAAAAGVLNGGDDDNTVKQALFVASSATNHAPACAMRPGPRAPNVVPGRASAAVLRQLGVFRRPATAADRVPTSELRFGGDVLRDSVRVARASDGVRYLMYVSRGLPRFSRSIRDPVACVRAAREAALAWAAAHAAAAVQARVRRIMDGRAERTESLAAGRTETLTVVSLRPDGRLGGGGATIIANGRVPAMGSVGIVRVNGRTRVELSGVVPDGVASVRILDRAGPRKLRARPQVRAVRDNVWHALLARRMGQRMTVEWRSPSGAVVRRVHPRY